MVAGEGAANPALPAAVREDFELVRRNVELEARLIDDMLDITRVIQGKLALQRVPVDLHDTIRRAVEITAAAAAVKSIAPVLELRAGRAGVAGDPERLQQVFINLLGNAIKFTPAAGSVTVATRTDDARGRIVVRITDTGIGLRADEIGRIFQPFAQGSHAGETGSPVYGGLGLGLAIVEELTVRHGGRVNASSPGPGQGATFEVELPLIDEPAAAAGASRPEAAAPAPGRRILLVEDHANTRAVLARLLMRRGHQVLAVGTRVAAVDAAARQDFDVLVSDLGLPDGDGCGLFRELRTLRPGLTGIAISGFGMAGDLRRSTEAGFSAHLVKPVTVAKVEAALAQLRIGRGG
jgi:CheY-like chemotaxis protein